MTVLTIPRKHPAKRVFNEEGIPLTAIAYSLGVSYHHLAGVINGHIKPSMRLNERINYSAEEAKAGRLRVEESA